MAKTARRALIESVKADVSEAGANLRESEVPFSAESFFDGLNVDELFGESFEVTIDEASEQSG
ncbi:MAG: hypothetical protein HYY84_19075 [Deltaproteobacteria bacterium]|nr:hypothetical protein [Deltaproteobacteria bacterium]